ncbi:uncharacterized protein PHALS_03017 [Plasmopara halstedii]|uniref:Uncharacterized protein n=1 Tax=Plasmopara halstedii TaxID=4781 RepID=A0A0P1A8C4_PLAHL|nr:uncharacterized protein PHALS_03017 [Plasmopara halstedii]CEG36468.1 hypothetical protein PHALS_03017 [Plasmopara halstedii]|eukprot:XP_024572837.1 hypothetical protein PHALS_03017 [Plasmopara halstedii]
MFKIKNIKGRGGGGLPSKRSGGNYLRRGLQTARPPNLVGSGSVALYAKNLRSMRLSLKVNNSLSEVRLTSHGFWLYR